MTVQTPPSWLLHWGPVQEFLGRLSAANGPPATFTSWWRSAAHNRDVGGNAYSQHLLGLAADLVPPSEELAQVFREVGLVAIVEGDHVHVQRYAAGTVNRIIDTVRAWL